MTFAPPRNFLQRQIGGGSVMDWGAFSSKGLLELAILRGKQASDHYVWREYLLHETVSVPLGSHGEAQA